MQTWPMSSEDYGDMARRFLREADANFGLGEYLDGSERMWDAAAHAVMAVSHRRDWLHKSRQDLDLSVARLAEELRSTGRESEALSIDTGYVIACNSYINFYHRDMGLEGGNGRYFATARKAVHRFVETMLTISESSGDRYRECNH